MLNLMAVANCPALCNQICDEDELLRKYFDRGYTYKDIRDFMEARHGVHLTEDQLRRKLTRLGLRRRGNDSPLEEVEAAIEVWHCYVCFSECTQFHVTQDGSARYRFY